MSETEMENSQTIDEEEDLEEEETEDDDEDVSATTEATEVEVAVVAVKSEPKVKTDQTPVETIKLTPDYEQIDAYKTVLSIMDALGIDEALFSYNGNVSMRQMNPSRTAMLEATIDAGLGLTKLVAEQPKVTRRFTVRVDNLKKVMKKSNKLTLEIGQGTMVAVKDKTKVTLPLLEDSEEEIPDISKKLTLDITTVLNYEELSSELQLLTSTPEALKFASVDGKLRVTGSNDLQKFETELRATNGKEGAATYCTELLHTLKGHTWNVMFSKDMPLKATTTITKYSTENGHTVQKTVAEIALFLAPRIEQD
jgi:hypothetical protein